MDTDLFSAVNIYRGLINITCSLSIKYEDGVEVLSILQGLEQGRVVMQTKAMTEPVHRHLRHGSWK